jgi:hypothetical protein
MIEIVTSPLPLPSGLPWLEPVNRNKEYMQWTLKERSFDPWRRIRNKAPQAMGMPNAWPFDASDEICACAVYSQSRFSVLLALAAIALLEHTLAPNLEKRWQMKEIMADPWYNQYVVL